MKFTGAEPVLLLMIYIGLRISGYYRNRSRLLEYTVEFLNKLRIDFKYKSSGIYDFLIKYTDEEVNSDYDYISKCVKYVKEGYDFPVAFRKSVMEERLLTRREKEKLISFGDSLGTSSIDTQLNIIDFYKEFFERNFEYSRSVYEKNSKTSLLICTFIGLGFYIITI